MTAIGSTNHFYAYFAREVWGGWGDQSDASISWSVASKELIKLKQGSGCDSVGRAVASDTRGPRFESSHRQIYYLYWTYIYCQLCIEKTKIKTRPGMAHFLLNKVETILCREFNSSRSEPVSTTNTYSSMRKYERSAMELFSSRKWRLDRPKQKAVVYMLKHPKIMQHLHGIISKLFDCWANPVVHLILLKSSMNQL